MVQIIVDNCQMKSDMERVKQISNDGSISEGYWVDDQLFGYGRQIFADGESNDGKACGYGEYHYLDGASYKGQWENDQQNGIGLETWPDGAVFEGEFVDGQKQGKGIFKWANGEMRFQSKKNSWIWCIQMDRWKRIYLIMGNDKLNGFGTFTWDDGRKYTGNVSIKMIRNLGEIGKMVNNIEKVSFKIQWDKCKRESGKIVKKLGI